jgi:hypothetical protein
MQLLEEWHIEVHVPPRAGDDVTDRIAGDVEAAVRQFADDLTHRLRFAYRLGNIEVRASR